MQNALEKGTLTRSSAEFEEFEREQIAETPISKKGKISYHTKLHGSRPLPLLIHLLD
jgi:hypothetical protein